MDLLNFFRDQLNHYPLAATNYKKLEGVKIKEFPFGNYKIRVHFNPARAISTLAKLDPKTIAERPCFLCAKNRPAEQGVIDFKGKYDLCINPFPICDIHFTVISKQHEKQVLGDKIIDMLDLAQTYPGFIALYNGAHAGASAPDHFHFQLVNADYYAYPVEWPMPELIVKETFTSANQQEACTWLQNWIATHKKHGHDPIINVFCEFKNQAWTWTVFPRKCHRSHHFYAKGKSQLMMSPGAIDMTGNLIVSREEDFEKITAKHIEEMFHEVSGYAEGKEKK